MIDGIQRVGVGADLNLRGARRRGSLIAGSTLLILCGQEETNGVLPKVDAWSRGHELAAMDCRNRN